MEALQKARLAIVQQIMDEEGLGSESTVNIRVHLANFRQNGDDWTADFTTDAHTDRNYTASYSADSGRLSIRTFRESKEVTLWDERPPMEKPPKDELFGVDMYTGVSITGSKNVQIGDGNNQTNYYR